MPSTRRPAIGWLAGVFLIAVAASAAAIPVRATYGAQVTADEPQYLLTALSIFEDGDLDIADELADRRWEDFHQPGELPEQTKPLADGRRVSPHDPLLPLLLAVPMGLGGWVAAKFTLALLAGTLAALLCWIATRRLDVPPHLAAAIVALFAASVPLASYGHQVYPEIPAALAVAAALAALLGPLRRGGCWVLTSAVIALPWLAVKYAPVAATLAAVGLLRLWRAGRRGPALGIVVAGVCAAAVFAGVHLVVWGGLTPYASGDHFVGGEFTVVGSSPNYLGRSSRLLGLLVDRHFGIAAWQPAWLLGVPAMAIVLRRGGLPRLVLGPPLLAGWLTATFLALTMHGYWAPGRQIVVVLPAAVLALAVAAARVRVLRATLPALGALGVWSYVWLVVVGRQGGLAWIVDFFTTPDPWYRAWSWLLPSYVNPSAAVWTRHGVWLAALVGLAATAWRAAPYSVAASVVDPEADPDDEPDDDPPSSMVRTPAPSSEPHAASPNASTNSAPARRRDIERDDTGFS